MTVPKRILLDTDPGIDDALAILLALASPEVQLEAITVAPGNCSTAQGVINARDIRKVDEDTAIDAGIYTFTLTENGQSRQVQARYTYVYERIDGEWKIVLHHSSAMPEPVAHLASN